MRRVLFWSSLTLFLLVVCSATWLWTADLRLLKPQIEDWVTEKTGREFEINGRFSIDLGLSSTVIAENVRFANAEWAETPQMATIGRAEIHVNLGSLFKGPVVVELIDIDDAEIHLVGREGAPPNWDFEIGRKAKPKLADEKPGPQLLLSKIDVDRVNIFIDSPARSRPLDFQIESLDQVHSPDDMLDFALDASIDDSPVTLEGKAGGAVD